MGGPTCLKKATEEKTLAAVQPSGVAYIPSCINVCAVLVLMHEQDKARAEAENLREEFASGKKTALEAIERLKERMREVKEEEAQARKRMQENHESRIEKMKAEVSMRA